MATALCGTGLPLGISPAGSTNVTARELGIPTDAAAAVALLFVPQRHALQINNTRHGGERRRLLNALQAELDYLQITTPVMREAASLWAEARQQGVATADRHALDGDVILAAIARLLIADGHDVVVATTNIGHLARFVPTQLWHTIT